VVQGDRPQRQSGQRGPRSGVALAQRKTSKKQPRGVMSLDDVRAVIAAAESFDPAAALALRIAAMTGARRAELAALRWTDVDDDGMLTIDSAIEVIRHEDEPRELRDAPTKTANARRLTLDPTTHAAIWELRREREPYGPWMFGVGEEMCAPDRIGWWWTRARKLSGIDKKWRLHDLRHWSATVAIGQGHDVRTVANRLGHSNPAMTLRVYAHAFAAADQKLAASLADLLDPEAD
ncbi:MAG: site-specific integrase, partial [Acidimicrobiales bacterium]